MEGGLVFTTDEDRDDWEFFLDTLTDSTRILKFYVRKWFGVK